MRSQQNSCVHQLIRRAVLYFAPLLVLCVCFGKEFLTLVYIFFVSGCQMDAVWLQVHTVANSHSGMQ